MYLIKDDIKYTSLYSYNLEQKGVCSNLFTSKTKNTKVTSYKNKAINYKPYLLDF